MSQRTPSTAGAAPKPPDYLPEVWAALGYTREEWIRNASGQPAVAPNPAEIAASQPAPAEG